MWSAGTWVQVFLPRKAPPKAFALLRAGEPIPNARSLKAGYPYPAFRSPTPEGGPIFNLAEGLARICWCVALNLL